MNLSWNLEILEFSYIKLFMSLMTGTMLLELATRMFLTI